MSGLLAIFNPSGVTAPIAELARRFPSGAAARDVWKEPRFEALRFHHGACNAGAQPVWNEARTLCLFMDGEVFADTPGDVSQAATCLAIVERDPAALAELNGSFALIVYNRLENALSLVSDRMNTRPLYYFQKGSELVIASHVAALTGHPGCPRTLDRQSLHELISYRQVLGGNTIYEGIRWMEPGSIVTFDGAREKTRTYWRMRWREPSFARNDLPRIMAETIRTGVRRRLSSPRRHGLFLSGGLDSRMILAAADEPLPALTLGDVETDQLSCAREAARIKGSEHHVLDVSADDFWHNFQEGVRLTGGMYGCQHNHFLPVLARARRHCDVAFSGSYLDTILRGSFMPTRRIAIGGVTLSVPWPAKLPRRDLATLVAQTQKTASPMPVVSSVLTAEARADHEARLREGVRGALLGFDSPYPHHAWSYLMIRSMPHNLGFPNVLSVRTRMDVDILAWDRDLLELALEIPPAWAMPDDAYRQALALLSPALARLEYANEGLRADANAYLRTAYRLGGATVRAVQTRLLDRRPLGGSASWLDFSSLLRRPGPLRARLQALPRSEALEACGIFDPLGLQGAVDDHLQGRRNYAKFLLMLLTIDEWIRQFGADGVGAPRPGTRSQHPEPA